MTARATTQANVSQTENPSKNLGHYELVHEPHLTLKTLHLPTQLICVFHASRTAKAHFCQQNSLFGFCNRGNVCFLWGRNCTCMRVLFEDEREENLGRGREKATVLQRKWGTIFDSEDSQAVPANAYTESSLKRRYSIVTLRGYAIWCDLLWVSDRREKLNEVLAQLWLNFYMNVRKAASEVCSAGGTGTKHI